MDVLMVQPGDVVELIDTDDPNPRLRPGARGQVIAVEPWGVVRIVWDGGIRLGLIPGRDRFRVLPPEGPS